MMKLYGIHLHAPKPRRALHEAVTITTRDVVPQKPTRRLSWLSWQKITVEVKKASSKDYSIKPLDLTALLVRLLCIIHYHYNPLK